MIGFLKGQVIYSDGQEAIILSSGGIGHQLFYPKILPPGSSVSIYITQIFRENDQSNYGFSSLVEKKLFELLVEVKGVGPKSAFSLLSSLGEEVVIESIILDNKKALTRASGIGQKAAAQIVLDLGKKIQKFKQTWGSQNSWPSTSEAKGERESENESESEKSHGNANANATADNTHEASNAISDALLACQELGFEEIKVIPLLQKYALQHQQAPAEELLQMVLKNL